MASIREWLDAIRDGRVGFSMFETMSGSHRFWNDRGPGGRHPFRFEVEWGTRRLGKWLDPHGDDFLLHEMKGTITAEGLCNDTPCSGQLRLRYFDEHRLEYSLDFQAGGRNLHFVGEKVNIKLWNLPVSHTVCFGVIFDVDDGVLVSTSESYFRFSSVPSFVGSFRPRID